MCSCRIISRNQSTYSDGGKRNDSEQSAWESSDLILCWRRFRHGMQCITLTVFLTFFLGLFYRSASLYHPQRRAILHLKNQRRKVKDKNRRNNRTPFFDCKTLRSKTVRITLASTACSAFGLYLPILHLAQQLRIDGLDDKMLVLQTNMGLAWMLGAFVFGFLVIRNNAECRIARQYLCQASLFMCAICMLALAELQANYEGYFIIVWAYGKSSSDVLLFIILYDL